MVIKDMMLLIGDLHAIEGDNKSPNPKGEPQQQWLANGMDFVLEFMKLTRKQGYNQYLALGGDLVDLPGLANRTLAGKLLRPFMEYVDDPSRVHGVLGTEFHVGRNGEEDIDVMANHLGIPMERIAQGFEFRLGDRLFWHAHHGLRLGKNPWNMADPLYRIARDKNIICKNFNHEQPPHYIIGHHYHRHVKATYEETTALVCPAWKLQDSFTHKILQWSMPPSIGALAIFPQGYKDGRTIVPLLLDTPREYQNII